MRWSAELMELLARDEVCLLQDGGWCNPIYVDDLIAAIGCALDSDEGVGQAFFITDGSPLRWSEYISAHARLLGIAPVELPRQDALPAQGSLADWMRASFLPLLPVARTAEFRAFVLKSPLMQATLFRAYLRLRDYPQVKARLERLKQVTAPASPELQERWHEVWARLQLSEARLSSARAGQVLGFSAKIDFAEGLKRTIAWFERYGLVPAQAVKVMADSASVCV
jgi:nucleoside-diphosphate-sugar epimerase